MKLRRERMGTNNMNCFQLNRVEKYGRSPPTPFHKNTDTQRARDAPYWDGSNLSTGQNIAFKRSTTKPEQNPLFLRG